MKDLDQEIKDDALALLRKADAFFARPDSWSLPGMDPDGSSKSLWWALSDLKDRKKGEAHFLVCLAALSYEDGKTLGRTTDHQNWLLAWEREEGRTVADVRARIRRAARLIAEGRFVQGNDFAWSYEE